jgi:hypothetical protein
MVPVWSSSLIRWGGLAAMLGGALWIVMRFLITFEPPPLDSTEYSRLLPAPLLLLLVGLMAVQAQHVGHAGWPGWTGSVVAFIGLLLLLAGNVMVFWMFSITGILTSVLGTFTLCLGLALVGIATIRAKVLPRWSRALPLIIGLLSPVQYFASLGSLIFGDLPGLVLTVLFGTGWAVLGYALWSDTAEPRQPRSFSGHASG